jgi:Big-like domain-containing protein
VSRHHLLRSPLALALVAFLSACSGGACVSGPLCEADGGGGGAAVTVTLTAPNNTMNAIGATIQIAANVQNSGAAPTWASDNVAAVRVNASGLATAVADGAATITATVGGVSATVNLTVAQTVADIVLTPTSITFSQIGQTQQAEADPQDANGNTVASATVEWAWSDGAVATVSATGLVLAEGNGVAEIQASAGGRTASIGVLVSVDIVAPEVVSVVPANTRFEVALDDVIVVTFTEDIDPTGVDQVVVMGPAGRVPGTTTFSGPRVTFRSDAPLQGLSQYDVTVTTSVTDLAGNPLAADVPTVFWTQPDPMRWYTLSNQSLGPTESLTTVGDVCTMTTTVGAGGLATQRWRFFPLGGGNYSIRNFNTGNSRQLEAGNGVAACSMDPTAVSNGQGWSPVPDGSGSFLLHSLSFADTKALDTSPFPVMTDLGPVAGQRWVPTDDGPVLSPQGPASSFLHEAADAAGSSPFTTITGNDALTANPTASVIVTPNFNPGGVGGTGNNNPLGMWYTSSNWTIYNQFSAPFATSSFFNVLVPTVMGVTNFVHTATLANSGFNSSEIDDPELNGNPDAILFIMPYFNPNSVDVPNPIGVWYFATTGRWNIFLQDAAMTIPDGSSYFVMLANTASNAYVHVASVSNQNVSGSTILDHPELNDRPNALVTVTQNWNPAGSSGVFNDANYGVAYDGLNWLIFNQDGTPIPDGAAFNVLIGDGFASFN